MKKQYAMILCVLILMSAALPAAAFEESQLSPVTGLYPSVYIDQGLYYYRRPNSSMDGVINNRGEIIVADGQFPQITSQAHDFSTGQTVLYVTKRDPITSGLLYGIMDLQGNWVLPCKFTEITAFYDDLAFAKSYEGDDSTIQKSWIVGLDGRQVPLTSDYDRNMSRFGCGAAVLADGTVVDGWGNTLFSVAGYQFAPQEMYFSDGLLLAQDASGRWGYLDLSGQVAIPFTYSAASSFSNGRAAMYERGQWGYIDTNGQMIIQPAYSKAESFIGDLACVRAGEEWQLIGRDGQFVMPFGNGEYSSFHGFTDGLAVYERDGFSYLVDDAGEILLITEGLYAPSLSEGTIQQRGDLVFGAVSTSVLIDTEGRRVTPEGWNVEGNLCDGYILMSRNGESENASFAVVPSQEQPAFWAQDAIEEVKTQVPIPIYMLDQFDKPVRRDAFAALIDNICEFYGGRLEEYEDLPFDDLEDSNYIRNVRAAHQLGLVDGVGGRCFSPDTFLTREEMAKMLSSLDIALRGGSLPSDVRTSYSDDGDISSWAVPYVAYCQQNELLDGVGDNMFAPKQTVDRQTALVMAAKLAAKLGNQEK